jgi:hypothetical protein
MLLHCMHGVDLSNTVTVSVLQVAQEQAFEVVAGLT